MVRRVSIFLSVAALIASVVAARADHGGTPGEQSLVNFDHVYNSYIQPVEGLGTGTGLEFFSLEEPVLDEHGDPVIDENGRPVVAVLDYAIVGALRVGAIIFDITDPEHPSRVSTVACDQFQNNPQVKWFGDRLVVALSHDNVGGPLCLPWAPGAAAAGGGISLFDITDPASPVPMYSLPIEDGAHTFTFHPTQPVGWSSAGDIPGGRDRVRIVNFTDLANPTIVNDVTLPGSPHDMAFSADGNRGYVAAENHIRIYDTTNALAPTPISGQVSPGTYVHDAFETPDGSLMLVVNESLALGGFFVEGTTVCPGEGLSIYALADPLRRAPVQVGYYLPEDLYGNGPDARACTAHVGKTAPNSKYHVMGWYIGGVRVVDLTIPAVPREIGRAVMADGEVWSAKMYKGPYVYTADQVRGFDVFRWTGPSFYD